MPIDLADVLDASLVSEDCASVNDGNANVVDGLYAIAYSLGRVADAINGIGLNGAATSLGAIELLAREVRDGMSNIAASIDVK